jgi:hypothetical protein
MPDLVIFRQSSGRERVWVPEADVERWLTFWGRQGVPACRWRDYRSWGGFFPPHPESVGEVMIYPRVRSRRIAASR